MSSARSAAMDVDEVHVQQIIFDSNMYKEGRPCVLVRTCDRKGSSQYVFGDWVGARVLLWGDQQHALHVTMVKAVSKPVATESAFHALLTGALSPAAWAAPRVHCGRAPICDQGQVDPRSSRERRVDTRRGV